MEIEQKQYQKKQVKVYSFWKDKKNYTDVFKIKSKIMSEVNIFMPVIIHKFDLQIIEEQKLLNIFEETILKLAEIEIIDPLIIHDAMLLEEDLIKFIQNKLVEKNLINKDNKISNNGINYLIQNDLYKKDYDEEFKKEIKNKENKYKNQYIHKEAYAFEGINQELSHIIEFRNIQNMCITGIYQEYLEENLTQKDKTILNFSMKIGSAGNAQIVNGILDMYNKNYLIENSQINSIDIKENFNNFFLSLEELDNNTENLNKFLSIIENLNLHKENFNKFLLSYQNEENEENEETSEFINYIGKENKKISGCNLEQLEKIKIINKEKGYIHYKVIILDGDAENIVVSDGLSRYDSKLAMYIKKNYMYIFEYLNKIATKSKSISKNKNKKYNKNININDKYNNIKQNLKPITTSSQLSIYSIDKQNRIKIQNNNTVGKYYKAINLSIYHYIKNSNFDYKNSSILNNFINLSSKEEKIIKIKELLDNININTIEYKNKNHHKLFELDSEKILNYKNNSSSISTKILLLLVVIEANQNKENSNFFIFINNSEENKHKVFLKRVFQILNIRNKNSHGQSNLKNYSKSNSYNDENDQKKYYNYVYELVNYLLEDFYIDKLDNTVIDTSNDASQEIVNANTYLFNKFGILTYHKIFKNNEHYLRQLALTKINYSVDNNINIHENIICINNLFESIFRLHIQNLQNLNKNEKIQVSKDEVLQKLSQNLPEFNISSELTSVREEYFENACYCHNSSIGAYLLLFINYILTKKNNQNNIDELQIIITKICQIINYRGNGNNNTNIIISNKELLNLLDDVFITTKKIIKIIE